MFTILGRWMIKNWENLPTFIGTYIIKIVNGGGWVVKNLSKKV